MNTYVAQNGYAIQTHVQCVLANASLGKLSTIQDVYFVIAQSTLPRSEPLNQEALKISAFLTPLVAERHLRS